MSEELWIQGEVNNWMKLKYSRNFRKISFMLETQVTSKTRSDWEKEHTDPQTEVRGGLEWADPFSVSTAMDWAHGKLCEAPDVQQLDWNRRGIRTSSGSADGPNLWNA